MEKRTLGAAYKFYCKQELTNAHSAEADTKATKEVLEAQLQLYDGQKVVDGLGNEIGLIENDMSTLHSLTSRNMIDLAGRFIFNENIPQDLGYVDRTEDAPCSAKRHRVIRVGLCKTP